MLYLLHLDDYHLDDLLFVQSLGRFMQGTRQRVVLVHGSGGEAERLLEAAGFFPARQEGRFAALTAPERQLVEAGFRQTNRMLVSRLTDSGVSAVGLHGGDRGLLRWEDGRVKVGNTQWLRTLATGGAVPVVSALIAGDGGAEPVETEAVLAALAGAFSSEPVRVVVLTRTERAGLGRPPAAELAPEALEAHAPDLADARVASCLTALGQALLVTSIPAFFAPTGPSGTSVGGKTASKHEKSPSGA